MANKNEIAINHSLVLYLAEYGGDEKVLYKYGIVDKADLSTSLNSEKIYNNVDGSLVAVLYDTREESFSVTSVFNNLSTDEISYGAKYLADQTITMPASENQTIESGSCTLTGEAIDGDVRLKSKATGEYFDGTVATKIVTVVGADDGDYEVIYSVEKTVSSLEINTDNPLSNYVAYLVGYATDINTNGTACHFCRKYVKASPTGELSRSYTKGNQNEDLKFECQADNKVIGYNYYW